MVVKRIGFYYQLSRPTALVSWFFKRKLITNIKVCNCLNVSLLSSIYEAKIFSQNFLDSIGIIINHNMFSRESLWLFLSRYSILFEMKITEPVTSFCTMTSKSFLICKLVKITHKYPDQDVNYSIHTLTSASVVNAWLYMVRNKQSYKNS